MELLDPDLHSIDEVYAQLQVYKKRREREQQELDHKIKTGFREAARGAVKMVNESEIRTC